MMYETRFRSVAELQALQRLACEVSEDVFIHSKDGKVRVDAKSFIGLFTLDFSLSLIHISEPTRPERISSAVFCLKQTTQHDPPYPERPSLPTLALLPPHRPSVPVTCPDSPR